MLQEAYLYSPIITLAKLNCSIIDIELSCNVTCLFRIIYLTERNLYDVFRPNEIFTCKLAVDYNSNKYVTKTRYSFKREQRKIWICLCNKRICVHIYIYLMNDDD